MTPENLLGVRDEGWRRVRLMPSLADVHRSVVIPNSRAAWIRHAFAFAGPGYLVAVGYMDPGNWATDLAGGSAFGSALLWVVVLSSLMAMVLQSLAARLGIVTGRDLAQACRDHYSRPVALGLWLIAELAICATDLAELAGTAIALELLFGIPLVQGVLLTGLDVLVVLWLQQRGFRYLEAFVVALILVIFACFAINLAIASPQWTDVAAGLIPRWHVMANPAALYIALGIVGATVMPHNLYLHSSIVQTRRYALDVVGRRRALRFANVDIIGALLLALLVNAGILVLSAATFHARGHHDVTEIQEAYRLLSPILGSAMAAVLFGVALLAAGQSSSLTATLAGQIVMEGFLDLRVRPWVRRLLTRSLAIIPALLMAWYAGQSGVAKLLILSQVMLSLQLPFAVIPLIRFTGDADKMGAHASPAWLIAFGWAAAALIVVLNAKLVLDVALSATPV